MKNVFFSLVFMLVGSLVFAHTNNTEIIAIGDISSGAAVAADDTVAVADDAVTSPEAVVVAPASCWIMQITVSCGGTYNTQYCDEGLHGTINQWVMQVNNWACNQQ